MKKRRLSRGKSHFDHNLWEISLCVSYPLHNRHKDKYGCQKELLQMLTSSFSELKANIMLLTYCPSRFLTSLALFLTKAPPWKHTHCSGVGDSRNQSVFTYSLLIRQPVLDNMKITYHFQYRARLHSLQQSSALAKPVPLLYIWRMRIPTWNIFSILLWQYSSSKKSSKLSY